MPSHVLVEPPPFQPLGDHELLVLEVGAMLP